MKRALPLLLGALLAACAWAPQLPQDGPCRRVYLFWPSESGNHTSLLIRRADFPVPEVFASSAAAGGARLLPGETPLPAGAGGLSRDWLEIGYASADYLRGLRNAKPVGFSIIFHKTPGAVYVRPFPWRVDPSSVTPAYTAFWPLDLPSAGYRGLLGYVAASFSREKDGRAAPPLFRDVGDKAVYSSPRPYSFRMFCNVWALEAVRAGGVSVSSWMPDQYEVQYWFENSYRPASACAAPVGPQIAP